MTLDVNWITKRFICISTESNWEVSLSDLQLMLYIIKKKLIQNLQIYKTPKQFMNPRINSTSEAGKQMFEAKAVTKV